MLMPEMKRLAKTAFSFFRLRQAKINEQESRST
jgi:hypothetical protein